MSDPPRRAVAPEGAAREAVRGPDIQWSRARRLIRQVQRRQRLVGLGRAMHLCLLVLAGLYGLLLVGARLLALIPDRFGWYTVLWVPTVAAVGAYVLHRRPGTVEAARLVDRRTAAKDLFLTVARLDSAAGEYKPLVFEHAESTAASIKPEKVVALEPWPRAGGAMVALGALMLASGLLPRLDPWGVDEQRQKSAQRRQQLGEVRKQTAEQAAALKHREVRAQRSMSTESALKELGAQLKRMDPDDKAGNLNRLQEQQEALGDQWRRVDEQRTAQVIQKQGGSAQRLGSAAGRQGEQWKQELEKGATEGLRKELDQLRQLAEQLARSTDPVEQQQLRQQLKQRLRELSDFATTQAGSRQLQAALSAALQQSDMSAMEGMSAEALEGLQESLQLTELQLESLAQAARDRAALREAMAALQQARALNDIQPLDGQQCAGCNSMAHYIAIYAKLMAQCQGGGGAGPPGPVNPAGQPGAGRGAGMGGPGQGEGNIAPENPTVQTAFKTEKAQTFLSDGRILMQWKMKEAGERGEVVKDYRESIRRLRDSVDEAILAEEIPPGYHDPVKKYFGNIGEQAEAKP